VRSGRLQEYETAERILAVTDAVDDGAVTAVDALEKDTFRFSPTDGKANDQTIQSAIGGRIKAIYKDEA
jgi:hypothetical protein